MWAIRLAKVSGNVLINVLIKKNQLLNLYTEQVIFSNKEKEVNVCAIIKAEGLEKFTVVKDLDLNKVILFRVNKTSITKQLRIVKYYYSLKYAPCLVYSKSDYISKQFKITIY